MRNETPKRNNITLLIFEHKIFRMKKLYLVLVLMYLYGSLLLYADKIKVVDLNDKTPVSGVSVLSSSGLILGFTDEAGELSIKIGDLPLSLRSIGYETVTINDSQDTIFLKPAVYTLSDIEIKPGDRPITRVITYAREYCTGATPSDTLQMYNEYMLEYFFAEGKVKGYDKSDARPYSRNERRYGRIANSSGLDSVMRPKYNDDIASLSFLSNMAFVPFDIREETEVLKNGAQSDTILGKYYPKFIYFMNDNFFTVDCDALSDHKEHKWSPWFFKMFGMTMEMQQADWSILFNKNDEGKYGIYDFIFGTYNLKVIGKGKMLKKMIGVKDTIDIYCYIEQYPVEIERLTVEEYKDLKEDYFSRKEDFKEPSNLQPLPETIEKLVKRIDSEILKK
ncbi:MAG: hypothetical protein J1F16_10565 [Muribaculaceae bacterium]|nr:hypothetical protein [Muribaculaceae bacterium]